ncbi:hypothetical protein KQ804_14825, partial [Listeria monocytogenes]|nr:hypothetical protein [Listeria monocytogenes]MCG4277872.1 hypothetical protein [Listeria monocytogenes]
SPCRAAGGPGAGPAYAVAIRRSDPPDGRPGVAGKPGAARPGRGGRHLLRGLGGGGVATGLPGAGTLLGPVSAGGETDRPG